MVGAGDLACQLDRDVAAGHRQSCVAQERRNRTDSATGRIETTMGNTRCQRQVSLQELESKLDSYIHDVEKRCDGRREPRRPSGGANHPGNRRRGAEVRSTESQRDI